MKKNNLILMVITIAIFLVVIVASTFAYFASNVVTGNGLDMSITTDNNNIAFASTAGYLNLVVPVENMTQGGSANGDVIAAGTNEETGRNNMAVTLSTNTEVPIACTYNVYFQWDNGNEYLTPTVNGKKEFTLELSLEDEDGNGNAGRNLFASETQFTDIIKNKNKVLVVEGAKVVGSSLNSGRQEWNPTVRFYNLKEDQSDLAGRFFTGKFTVEDVVCVVEESSGTNSSNTLSQTIIGKVSDSEYISSQDGTKYVVRLEEVEYNNETLNAGIRYEGKDPDNYIQFNGTEEWRIIGVFEGSTIGLEPGKQYTKIIRNTPVTEAWDDYENDWINSTLNEYLNNNYLNGKGVIIKDLLGDDVKTLEVSARNKIAKYNEDYSTWYLLGATFDQNTMATSSEWFLIERFTGGAGYRNRVQGNADKSSKSAIALMYPSDYGYAAYGEGCNSNTNLSNYGGTSCGSVDWLLYGLSWEWLLSPAADDGDFAYYIYSDAGGDVYAYDDFLGNGYWIRPTLYLEHNVTIKEGKGTKLEPYILN